MQCQLVLSNHKKILSNLTEQRQKKNLTLLPLGPSFLLQFQPLLSNYAGGVKNAPPDSYLKNKKEGDLEDGAGSGEWGELNGWWTDKKRGIETFEVELFRPLGFKLAEVCDCEVCLW